MKPGAEPNALSPLEAEAILEIGYLALSSDGAVTAEEVDAFRRIAARLLPGRWDDVGSIELDARFQEFADALARTTLESRLGELTSQLERPGSRRQAYRIASALALCDLASNDRERDFDALLARTLGLSEGEADELAMDAYASTSIL